MKTNPLNHSPFPTIYLASASPRRHEILTQIGITHEVLKVPSPPGEDEPQYEGEPAEIYVQRTALEKAQRAQQFIQTQEMWVRPILAADTAVILDGQVLGKPSDAFDATKILSKLSNKIHEVHTAIVLSYRDKVYTDVSITKVYMRAITMGDLQMYIESGEYEGKAGAYGIQGLASIFIEKIEGSYSGVMGLPIFETWRLLKNLH